MFQKIAKHRANDASNDVHRPPLIRDAKQGAKPWGAEGALVVWQHSCPALKQIRPTR